jgi:hypothetical protein
MNFLQKLLQGIAFVPTIVNSIEALFGSHTGEQKKESAISFVVPRFSSRSLWPTAKSWMSRNSKTA